MKREEFIANIPEEMKQQKNWVAWILKQNRNNPSRMDKIPVNAVTKEFAQSDNPETWCKFEIALEYALKNKLNGIGFMLKPPFIGVDIDHCIDERGTLSPLAKEIVEKLNTYTEISPSGTGLHLFCRGELPPKDRKNSDLGLEIYTEGRFLTFTANRLQNSPVEAVARLEEVRYIHSKYLAKPEVPKRERVAVMPTTFTEAEIMVKAMNSKNGNQFTDLHNGSWQSYYGSQSEADLAFCNTLAFWSGADGQVMDSIFRQSGLYRDKWDKKHFSNGQTYGESVISKAISDCREVYSGPNKAKEEKRVEVPVIPVEEVLSGPSKRADMFFRQSYHRRGILGYKLGDQFKGLMNKLDGVQPGLYLCGAISNVGKTSWLLNLCKSLTENNDGLQVLFFSIDDNFRKIYFRLLAIETIREINYVSNIGQSITYNKEISDEERKKELALMDEGKLKLDELLNRFTLLDEVDGNSLEHIEQTIETVFEENPKLVVVVDNFHKIRTPNVGAKEPRNRFTLLSEEMKRITNRFDIPVLMTVELRKLNGNAPPTVDDLKDTVDLHYDSDIVFLLHSDAERNKDSIKFVDVVAEGKVYRSPIVDLIVAKNKLSGFKGTIEYVFVPSLAIYQEEAFGPRIYRKSELGVDVTGIEQCPWDAKK